MKAAVLHKPLDVRIEEVSVPRPKAGEVLVAMKSIGVCGSDVHFYENGRIGSFVVRKPMILGHESAGEVVKLGPGVKGLKVGDRVAIEPGFPCRRCGFCKTGRYNLCPDVIFYACPPHHGAYCEYQVAAADFAFKLPKNVSYDEGAMVEPLAVGMHACNRAQVGPGDSVAILGAGPIGLVTLQSAKARGATQLIAVDMDANRLKLAKKLGATDLVNASRKDTVKEVKRLTDGTGADVVMETAGAVRTTQQAVGCAKNGGRIVLVGMPTTDSFEMPVIEAIVKEVSISGLFRYANMYPPSIGLVASGAIDVKSMITKKFKLEDVPKALDFALRQGKNAIKILIHV
ncbi:MAG: NAD(P)-dependent alcohol dehydrogenase [Planctomycetes bacterium]|nr:NAD(P)-dependent alcohol dehydrogenase [Planctomycetota bacterium]